MYGDAPGLAYRAFLLLAIATGGACALALLRRDGRCTPARALGLVGLALGAALTGAKAVSALERGGIAWHDPLWELGHGYRHPGGFLGLAAAAPVLAHLTPPGLTLPRLADALAPAAALALAVVRIGCFLAGCCHGEPSALPWAVAFPRGSLPWRAHLERGWIGAASGPSLSVHPLQLYFASTSLALGLLLLSRRRRSEAAAGSTFCLFLLGDGLLKLLLEQMRLDAQPHLQAAAAFFATAGLLGWVLIRRRVRKTAPRR